MFENLNRILGENNIPDNLKEILQNMNTNSTNSAENNKDKTETNSGSSISPEMIQNLLNMLNSNNHSDSHSSSNNNSNIDMEMIIKMKTIMDKMNSNKEDPRASLLLSLKPYLKDSRKNKVEQYVKLFNMTKVMEAFNSSGGDSK